MATEKVKAKADKPETLAQAVEWEKVKNHYVTLELCHVCAAQATYGHQIGFTKVNQPCPDCAGVVAGLPDGAANGWRSQSYRKTRRGAYGTGPQRKAYALASRPTVPAHTPQRMVPGGTWGPRSWELCYRAGGPREGLYEDDRAAFERLAASEQVRQAAMDYADGVRVLYPTGPPARVA